MGYWKNKQIEDSERGVDSTQTGYVVCQNCFRNPGLRKFISENALEQDEDEPISCDYCQPKDASATVADLDAVCEYIVDCLKHRYNDPAGELPYESAEGGYQGEVMDTWDLLERAELDTCHPELHKRIAGAINIDFWCQRDYFSLSPDQAMQFSWEEYQRVAKEGTVLQFMYGRFREDRESMTPVEFLDWLGEQLDAYGLVKNIPSGTSLYRVRFQKPGESLRSADELGPPPSHVAKANRLSPEGTVMMYCAEDLTTAMAETAQEPGTYAVGEFELMRDIRVLDLVDLPQPICFFDLTDAEARDVIDFLRSFAGDVSRPIASDEKPHVEYMPTQILTQHIRRRVRINEEPLDGIRYRSAKRNTGVNLGLFADYLSVCDESRLTKRRGIVVPGPWIMLKQAYETAT